ncbi:oxidoreductase [Pseudonocardia bannensis]|uniref:SDR family NAD(P)-dependent oxidoreductase n=1 Tax=Pseudonocardia bannensis TaxID=630973 RepID=A0A848DMC6_9PSEU|nr:oxidoreductase [Pseudonocardia bannensis]NMH93917.1 SDR family NAD(P)-dependent oxidoreductase [Pseudonocardia bannensis]
MTRWTLEQMPGQTGRTVLVTGATSGLGLASAIALAAAGAHVLLTARDRERGKAALTRVQREGGPGAELIELDLADLGSVREAAADVRARTGDTLHVLMNNAGVMGTPPRFTVDGFELQIGTNHLGHAALTWLLMPALRGAGSAERPARVVTLSSLAHRGGGLDVEDLHFTRRRYLASTAYSASKLANLLFAAELDRRLRDADGTTPAVISVAAHPGLTDTDLLGNSMRLRSRLLGVLSGPANKLVTQPVRTGMLPQLYAATAPQVRGGDYIGPGLLGETRGHPAPARRSRAAEDVELARRLWERTAAATSVQPDPR